MRTAGQFSLTTLGYSNSLCGNYCSTSPTLTLGSTDLDAPDYDEVSELSDAFFVPSDYRGAFDQTTDWTLSWASFCPQNNVYCSNGHRGMKTTGMHPTSIEDADFQLYPNPSDGTTYAEFTAAQSGKVQITVSNAIGQTVCSISSNVAKGRQKIAINTSGLSSGVYMVKVEMAKGDMVQTRLLVK